jgi:hypothetical protein
MGIRLNILDNPAVRMQLSPMELAQAGPRAPANQPAPAPPEPEATGAPATPAAGVGSGATFPLDGRIAGPQAPLAADIVDGGQLVPDNAPPSVIEANAEANRPDGLDGGPAPRFPDFRFFVAAGSTQERALEVRLDLLEQRLEAVNNRLRFADSLTLRIDAQLDRARLERDLEMVSSEIQRMRLERVFARPAPESDVINETRPPEEAIQPSGTVLPQSQQAESARATGLDLLA